jgi:hypothetical protein
MIAPHSRKVVSIAMACLSILLQPAPQDSWAPYTMPSPFVGGDAHGSVGVNFDCNALSYQLGDELTDTRAVSNSGLMRHSHIGMASWAVLCSPIEYSPPLPIATSNRVVTPFSRR